MSDSLRKTVGLAATGVLALCLRAGTALGQQVLQGPPGGGVVVAGNRPAAVADPTKVIPLVNTDEELSGYLAQAREMIHSGDFPKAIEILQALLDRTNASFIPAGDGHRYLSLSFQASEVLGGMGQEGLGLYRRLYDAQAQDLFSRSAAANDVAGLQEITRRFLQTHWGPAALNQLGAIYFDRGQFAQAARVWRDALGRLDAPEDRPMRMAKVAIALHLSGDPAGAQRAADELAKDFPQAQATLGGQEQPVVAYVRQMLSRQPASRPATAAHGAEGLQGSDDWVSLAGSPTGLAVMSNADPVLTPQWSQPEGSLEKNGIIRSLIGMTGNVMLANNRVNAPPRGQATVQLSQQEGRTVFSVNQEGFEASGALPPALHPLVVGSSVLTRTEEGITAYDLATGQVQWQTLSFPVYRQSPKNPIASGMFYNGGMMQDEGLFTLSYGQDLVFAVGQFLPRVVRAMLRANPGAGAEPDNSVLAAYSVSNQGRKVWQVGNGAGQTDLLREGQFLTAPTYADGKVYAIAQFRQGFHIVCLQADDGRLLWSSPVSQLPPMSEQDPLQSLPAGPLAVGDGKVYIATHAGVLAAFGADNGRAIWAYQYDSLPRGRRMVANRAKLVQSPPNPLILVGGNLLALPTDSTNLLALRGDTGELIWQADRAGQADITALDENRLILSGPEVHILEAASGKSLWRGGENIQDVLGRPAVTTDSMLFSGIGRMIRVGRNDYAISQTPLGRSDSVLGNLICVHGRLLAAGTGAVAAYFTYDDARTELSARMAKASPAELPVLLYQRGFNALNARQPEEAIQDFQALRASLPKEGAGLLADKAQLALYRGYIARGDQANGVKRLESYTQAMQIAASPRSKGEMLLRLARLHEQAGQVRQAVEIAQSLTNDYAQVELGNVGIGPAASLDDSRAEQATGYVLGHQLIAEFIHRHGQEAYGMYDTLAKELLDKAQAGKDPAAMLLIAQQYRNSIWAPMSLLQAAELNYNQAAKTGGQEQRELFNKSGLLLQQIIREYGSSGLAASAHLGMTLIYKQVNPRVAFLTARVLEKLPPSTQVSFGGVSGTLGQLAGTFHSDEPSAARAIGKDVPLPLGKLWEGPANSQLLCDSHAHPLEMDGSLFLWADAAITRFNPAAGSWPQAVLWSTQVPMSPEGTTPPPAALTGLMQAIADGRLPLLGEFNADGSVLDVVAGVSLLGLDPRSGKPLWQSKTGVPAMSNLRPTMTAAEIIFLEPNGGVSVVDKSTGKSSWQHRIAQTQLPWRSPPQAHGGILLTNHGPREPQYTLFDLSSRRSLGSVILDPGAVLNDEGLLLGSRPGHLDIIEPVLQLDHPLVSLDLPENRHSRIVGQQGDDVLATALEKPEIVELYSISRFGQKVQEYATQRLGGRPAGVMRAWPVGDRVYVLSGTGPCLHAFVRETGKRLWSTDLSPAQPVEGFLFQDPIFLENQVVMAMFLSARKEGQVAVVDARKGQLAASLSMTGQAADRPRSPTACVIGNRIIAAGAGPVAVFGSGAPASAPAPAAAQPPATAKSTHSFQFKDGRWEVVP